MMVAPNGMPNSRILVEKSIYLRCRRRRIKEVVSRNQTRTILKIRAIILHLTRREGITGRREQIMMKSNTEVRVTVAKNLQGKKHFNMGSRKTLIIQTNLGLMMEKAHFSVIRRSIKKEGWDNL